MVTVVVGIKTVMKGMKELGADNRRVFNRQVSENKEYQCLHTWLPNSHLLQIVTVNGLSYYQMGRMGLERIEKTRDFYEIFLILRIKRI